MPVLSANTPAFDDWYSGYSSPWIELQSYKLPTVTLTYISKTFLGCNSVPFFQGDEYPEY